MQASTRTRNFFLLMTNGLHAVPKHQKSMSIDFGNFKAPEELNDDGFQESIAGLRGDMAQLEKHLASLTERLYILWEEDEETEARGHKRSSSCQL